MYDGISKESVQSNWHVHSHDIRFSTSWQIYRSILSNPDQDVWRKITIWTVHVQLRKVSESSDSVTFELLNQSCCRIFFMNFKNHTRGGNRIFGQGRGSERIRITYKDKPSDFGCITLDIFTWYFFSFGRILRTVFLILEKSIPWKIRFAAFILLMRFLAIVLS